MLKNLTRPLIALVIALAPFLIFLGYTASKTVNGSVVSSTRINGGAIVAILIVLWMAYGYFRSAGKTALGMLVMAIALAVCAVHVTDALGVTAIWKLFPT